jgi:predicted O-methyltransferase YrrM
MFNDAGTEIEVSEFIYSLVRLLKPNVVVETGTHKGVSSTYIARALEDNKKGIITTFEIIPEHYNNAHLLWQEVGIAHRVNSLLMDAQMIELDGVVIDFLFLDSEPQLRFDEFIKFWPAVKAGGFIAIHDLHPSMGHHGQTYHGVYDWPYGDFRLKLGEYFQRGDIQTMHFPTPRGFTVFQKADPAFESYKYLHSEAQ